jgi:hypothetical protein
MLFRVILSRIFGGILAVVGVNVPAILNICIRAQDTLKKE